MGRKDTLKYKKNLNIAINKLKFLWGRCGKSILSGIPTTYLKKIKIVQPTTMPENAKNQLWCDINNLMIMKFQMRFSNYIIASFYELRKYL